MTSLILRNVSLRSGVRPLFAPLSATVQAGVVTSITGPSGAGKSSLLAYACGALPIGLNGLGDVLLGSKSLNGLKPEERQLGLLFQDDLLFPHLSVADNLAFGMRKASASRVERRHRIAAALESVGLGGFGCRDPATLSAGERARVALMRVLLSQPRAVLLDEPFGRLDPASRVQTREMVFAEIRSRSLPALLVTHDAEDVAAAGGPVVEIEPVEGR